MERQTRQQKVIDDIKNDLEGLRSEMAEIKKKQEEDLENRKKRKVDETDNSKDEPAKKFSMPQKQPTLPPYSAKSFKLKHTFDKISTLQDNETRMSQIEEHFGVNWILKICRSDGYIQFYFECQEPPGISYTVETNMKIMFGIGRYYYCYEKLLLGGLCRGFQNRSFIKWDTRNESRYIDNDTLLVKVDLDIRKMLGRKIMRDFGESMAKYSDLVLVVQDQKFHVSKLFLASSCPFFETMCLGSFQESGQAEIQLNDLDPGDVQYYLEVLYGHPAIDDQTVEGILLVADRNGTEIVKSKCEEFLLEKSAKPLKKKLEIFVKFHLEQRRIMPAFKTLSDVQCINPKDLDDLDKDFAIDLLRKVINFK
ncbi:unnamed protein product [Caenorhabditis brenneri]